MNTIKQFLFAVCAGLILSGCYDDYVKDYDENAVYFAYQTDVRTVVVGEGMEFSTGVVLAGVIDNRTDRVVNFEVDNSLMLTTPVSAFKEHHFSYIKDLFASITSIQELPTDHYALLVDGRRASQTVIRSGTHIGRITVRVDSLKFLSDASRVAPSYVIPLRLTGVTNTALYEPMSSTVIGVRYDNMLFGNYWHGGETVVKDGGGNVVQTIQYHTTVPQSDNLVWSLSTVAPFALTANAVGGELNSSHAEMKLTLNTDGTVDLEAVPGAKYIVQPDGASSYNRARLLQNRKIFLSYKYEKDGKTYHATDTLTFRNRIRDGVNEWQDENSANYQ